MNPTFTVELVKRSLESSCFPQPDPNVHENYWVKVYDNGNLITQVRDVHISHRADLFDDPEVLFPTQVTIENGLVDNYDVSTIETVIKDELIKRVRQNYEPDTENYNPGVIVTEDV